MPLYCPYPLGISIPAMLIPYLLVAGLVEAAFTVAIVAFVAKTSPGTIYAGSSLRLKPLYALVAALVAASPLGLLAAGTAWGEWGPDEIKHALNGGAALGFVPAGMAKGRGYAALLPDYSTSGLSGVLGYAISAMLGTAVLVAVFKLLGLLKRGDAAKAEA